MIDKYNIAILERWLKLAKTKGTDTIKIVCGDKIGEWIVTIDPKEINPFATQ